MNKEANVRMDRSRALWMAIVAVMVLIVITVTSMSLMQAAKTLGSENDLSVSEQSTDTGTTESGMAVLNEDEQTAINRVNGLIEELPSYEEIESRILEYDDSGDMEAMSAYYADVTSKIRTASNAYAALEDNLKQYITDYAKLQNLENFVQVQPAVNEINSDGAKPTSYSSTKDFVELNMYDYYGDNADDYGKTSINDPYKINKEYPGFQWNGGAYMYSSTFQKTGVYSVDYLDFGNCMITDYDYTWSSTGITHGKNANATIAGNKGGAINELDISDYGVTNRPIGMSLNGKITETSADVLKRTLGSDGYPALAYENTSLKYLFYAPGGYASKLNTESIEGLFKQDPVSGEYYYNSRWNHAQLDASENKITLYDQIITPNFILYPFGNFLPLNDITNDETSTQISKITNMRTYIDQLITDLEAGSEDATETHLIYMLGKYYDAIGSSWSAATALNDFFNGSPEPMTEAANFKLTDDLLKNMYLIDWDVDTNFFFGMEMKMKFIQPKDGLTGNDTNNDGTPDYPMTFKFSGDDDVWVYIDDVLFMDLSGIHRHVGGEIDFVNGKVHYYYLDTAGNGDVSETPYKTYTFEEILLAAGQSTDNLKGKAGSKTRFKDYTEHKFNFYYMERGSGSSVCRINFNFPMLKKNTISVAKAVTSDENTQGNPDFRFQVLAANADGSKPETDTLFIPANTDYSVYDEKDQLIRSGKTDANGVFTLKKGERAEFSGISENRGKYYVRELFAEDVAQQYDNITVSGEATTTSNKIILDSVEFTGVESPVKDCSDGSTQFRFTNNIDRDNLAALSISKSVLTYGGHSAPDAAFRFNVVLDGQALPAGTAYKVGKETRTVTEPGIITLKGDETAVISSIQAGSAYTVKEILEEGSGYDATYEVIIDNAAFISAEDANGTVSAGKDNKIQITNTEKGAELVLPVSKVIGDPNCAQNFTFRMVETDANWEAKEGGSIQETSVSTSTETPGGSAEFILRYPAGMQKEAEKYYYYEVSEKASGGDLVDCDDTVYRVAVKVAKTDGDLTAAVYYMARSEGAGADRVFKETETISFENTQLYSLSISKEVEDKDNDTNIFEFTVTLKDAAGDPVSGTFGCSGQGEAWKASCMEDEGRYSLVFDENGQAAVQLMHGESVSINGLAAGTAWSVKENVTLSDGYKAYYQVNDGSRTEGFAADGTIAAGSSDNGVLFINEAAYLLPESGGSGNLPFTAAGLLLFCGAALILMRRCRREN